MKIFHRQQLLNFCLSDSLCSPQTTFNDVFISVSFCLCHFSGHDRSMGFDTECISILSGYGYGCLKNTRC